MGYRKEFLFFKWGILVLGTAILLQVTGCGKEAEKTAHEAAADASTETLIAAADASTETLIASSVSESKEQDEPGPDVMKANAEQEPGVTGENAEPGPDVAEENAEQEPETPGNPGSSYGLGSAPFLKGKNILVSMFVTTPESSFTYEEKLTALDKLESAVSYIEAQAAEYNADVELLYDWTEHDDLCAEAATDFVINESSDYIAPLDEEIAKWFLELISYEDLIHKYDAQGIATCVFVNNPGISYAIVYDGTDNEKESIILFTGNYYQNGEEESAATYAHEILHVFGAHDLYEGGEFTKEVTDYLAQKYPQEIMTDVSEDDKYVITRDISPVTAYHLGWLAYTEEIDRFPQLCRE